MTVPTPHVRHLRKRSGQRTRHSKKMRAFASFHNDRLTVEIAKAVGQLTFGANAGDGKLVTIGSKAYTFQATLTEVDGHVKIGADAAASLANLLHAVNRSGGVVGTDYASATTAHADVEGLSSDATHLNVRAKVGGQEGNDIATTTDVASASWGAATLTGGEDLNTFDTYDALKRNTAEAIAAASSAGELS